MSQLVYLYQEQSPFEYQSERPAFIDPLETEAQGHDVYMLPPNATFTAPMEARKGYARCWNKTSQKWEEVEDHRGVKYWLPEQKHGDYPHTMKDLGPLPKGATTTEPPESREQKLAKLLPAVELALNAFVRTRGYDSIISCCSYATSSNEWYKVEGVYACDLRDRTWEEANSKYAELEEDDTKEVPSPEEFIKLLPVATAKFPVIEKKANIKKEKAKV